MFNVGLLCCGYCALNYLLYSWLIEVHGHFISFFNNASSFEMSQLEKWWTLWHMNMFQIRACTYDCKLRLHKVTHHLYVPWRWGKTVAYERVRSFQRHSWHSHPPRGVRCNTHPHITVLTSSTTCARTYVYPACTLMYSVWIYQCTQTYLSADKYTCTLKYSFRIHQCTRKCMRKVDPNLYYMYTFFNTSMYIHTRSFLNTATQN